MQVMAREVQHSLSLSVPPCYFFSADGKPIQNSKAVLQLGKGKNVKTIFCQSRSEFRPANANAVLDQIEHLQSQAMNLNLNEVAQQEVRKPHRIWRDEGTESKHQTVVRGSYASLKRDSAPLSPVSQSFTVKSINLQKAVDEPASKTNFAKKLTFDAVKTSLSSKNVTLDVCKEATKQKEPACLSPKNVNSFFQAELSPQKNLKCKQGKLQAINQRTI